MPAKTAVAADSAGRLPLWRAMMMENEVKGMSLGIVSATTWKTCESVITNCGLPLSVFSAR